MFSFLRRIFYFLILNFFIVITAATLCFFLMNFFDIKGELPFYMIFYSIIGFAGSFISLALSRWMAKKMTKVRVIDPRTATGTEKALVEMVHNLARKARLPKPPEVGIYNAEEINAFATGPSKKRSLVACSSGLIARMNKEELEGVLGHEIAHIANGDMVTMALLQGLINTMVLLAARLLARLIVSQQRNRSVGLEFVLYFAFQIAFSILGTIVLCAFSRKREYRADQGGAKLAGMSNMIQALKALQKAYVPSLKTQQATSSYNYLKISGKKSRTQWFSTHPPLEERIKKLETYYS